jgi:hypothetical protein
MIDIKEPMVSLINSALADGVPCLIGTAALGGAPQISPKGSVAVFDNQTLCYWERSHRTSEAAIVDNPKVVVYYRNPARAAEIPYRAAAFRIHGRARIVKDGPDRERAWHLIVPVEREKDPGKAGVAIFIEVDRVEELSGNVLMSREE